MTIVISLTNLTLLSLFCGGTIHSIWVIVDAFIFVGEHRHLIIVWVKGLVLTNTPDDQRVSCSVFSVSSYILVLRLALSTTGTRSDSFPPKAI